MPAKAKLVTRTATSTSVSTDNLNKGSELTHLEADSNFINLRDQTIGFASDDSTTTNIAAGDTLYIKGGTGITTAVSGDTITITNAGATGDITFSGNTISTGSSNANLELDASGTGSVASKTSTLLLGTGGADATITSNGAHDLKLNTNSGTNSAFINIADGTGIESIITLDTHGSSGKVYVDSNLQVTGSVTLASALPVAQGGTGATSFTNNHLLIGDGTSNINSQSNLTFDGSALVVGPITIKNNEIKTTVSNADLELSANGSGGVVASGIKIKGTSISSDDSTIININDGLVVDGSLTLQTGASVTGIADEDDMSSNSATQIATQQSIKAYADTKAVLTGSTNNTIATVTGAHALNGEANLTFDGSTLAVTGAATVSTTLGVTGASTLDGVTITDNTISTNDSNANLEITANGSGLVQLGAGTDNSSAGAHNVGNLLIHEVSSSGGTRHYANGRTLNADLTGDTSSGLTRFRIQDTITLDMAGNDSTSAGTTRGAQMQHLVELKNSSSNASTLAASSGQGTGLYIRSGGSGNLTVDDFYSIRSFGLADSGVAGTTVVTDYYHYYLDAFNTGSSGNVSVTNQYAFYDNGNLTSRFGLVEYANQSGDPSTVADTCHVYAKDVASSSKLFFRDEAGNVTQFSPHNEQDEWIFHSTNTRTGKTVRVNMEKMIRKLEEFTGETFIETE